MSARASCRGTPGPRAMGCLVDRVAGEGPAPDAMVVAGPHGTCAVVRLPADPVNALLMLEEEERSLTRGMCPSRVRAFAAGRHALRAAAGVLGSGVTAVLRGAVGEPLLPAGLVGSVSHDRFRAVALVAHAGHAHVGVDIETILANPDAIARQVLVPTERDRLRTVAAGTWRAAVTVSLCIKEAAQKALAPILGRLVHPLELDLELRRGGCARVELLLRTRDVKPAVDARWWCGSGEVLATARFAPDEGA